MLRLSLLIALLMTTVFLPALAQERNGQLFDPGATMTEPSDGAPEELSKMTFMLGQWDVRFEEFSADTLRRSGDGVSAITLMNRGHAIMERMYCSACADSLDVNLLSFLAFNNRANVWNLGEADGLTESISAHSGDFEDGRLVLRNAIRRGGGAAVTVYRTTYDSLGAKEFRVTLETSTDFQASWHPYRTRSYTRRVFDPDFLAPSSTYGAADTTQPDAARAFDFLIGTFDAPMHFSFPNGREADVPSTTTAVFALDGKGILEYGWYDVDPNLPDAATSIIRLYNRTMRRWESLFMSNRGNGALFFGGIEDGDEVILSLFEADLEQGPIQRYVFHDIAPDGYHWYGAQSFDRGQSYSKYWIIEATKTDGP